MEDEELPDRSGTLIADRYRLVKRLGAGGMGEVYKAVNEVVNREVAVKLLKPEYAKSPDVVQRVLREARAANEVKHPNVVDVLDVATDAQGAPVIVQELLVGEDLANFLRARGVALSEQEVLDLMIPVCEAVGAAHRAGIMHRDLKLENVFLHRLPNGTIVPKVLDFGLSRHIGEDAISRLTATGVAMGTPMYMSPEQVQGERDIDQRTDVWALGIMLYELTAGRLPFHGESLGAIFVKICTADPEPLRPLAPQVSDAYVAIVERCLRRERSARYPSAAELAADLLRLRQGAIPLDVPIAPNVTTTAPSRSAAPLSQNSDAMGVAHTLASAPSNGLQPPAVVPSVDARMSSRSIGPTVSQVPPPAKRLGIVATTTLVTIGLVVAGAWFASRPSAVETPPAHSGRPVGRPPVAVPAPTAQTATAQTATAQTATAQTATAQTATAQTATAPVPVPAVPVLDPSTSTPVTPVPVSQTPSPSRLEAPETGSTEPDPEEDVRVSRSERRAAARWRRRDASEPPFTRVRQRLRHEEERAGRRGEGTDEHPHRRTRLPGGGTTRFE
jgi:serine/threonine-protein kinase